MSYDGFKVGDEVMVVEGAWSKWLDGADIDLSPNRVHAKNADGSHRKFEILSVGCKIPIEPNWSANTLIREKSSLAIAAINWCNLFKEPEIYVRYYSNGLDLTDEISKESKHAILKANLGN